MGNKEDLLAGAKQCLFAQGYARTTARDIATAAGVSLAAIGYHYGTKDALLNEALRQAIEEWGDDLGRTLVATLRPGASPAERFEAAWAGVIESFHAHRPLWAIQFEVLARIDELPGMRQTYTESSRQARLGLAQIFGGADVAADEEAAVRLGAFYQVLLTGMAAQWMADPAQAPSGRDLLDGLRSAALSLEG
ncbi:TetR/AcrR family transcriptional regulator [Acrocarpospora sp. B8E8]|uniref:TetR/AcrR family transcriptional regulator n=1 Tax=Acrocarpospora sp. B8E8 TaxID=3153572 RepID=UPI00325DC11E